MRPPNVVSMADLERQHDPWLEPLPLVHQGSPHAYPVDALPNLLRAAVFEVQGFTKAPLPLVASSALAALSVAGQALADVQRADRLTGPTSLFLLTVADSGERKTTCDSLFLDPVRAWERQEAEDAKPKVADYRGDLATWEAIHEGLKARVRQATREGKKMQGAGQDVRDHEATKPQPPRVPRLIRVDATPEALAHLLAHEWPSAGVISSEAGLVFGSHGMGRDSVQRNLALLNTLWDGKPLPISRRTSDSYTVRGARLTVALQIQEAPLKVFFEQSDGLARGMGFLARFFIAWPESTQGTRLYTAPPERWPALDRFQRRIADLLDLTPPPDSDGALSPVVLMLAPEGMAAWITFHNDIEAELRSGGELYDVRDVAAKAADNVARLAALFHVLDHGPAGAIGADSVNPAGVLVAWHLSEARRFFGELALPGELVNATRLDDWLLAYCREHGTNAVPTREVQRRGPNPVRRRQPFDAAVAELLEAGRWRSVQRGRQKVLCVNPALLGGADGVP